MKRIPARAFQLTKEEQEIEDSLDETVPVSPEEHKRITKAIENTRHILQRREKNAILHMRINQGDLDDLKQQAGELHVGYQTYIAQILRQYLETTAEPIRPQRFLRSQSRHRMKARLSRNGRGG